MGNKSGYVGRKQGRTAFDGIDLGGQVLPAGLTITIAKGAANITNVTFQVDELSGQEYAATPLAGVFTLDIWASDVATGLGLTAAAFSTGFSAVAGVILGNLTANKAIRVVTDATGKFTLAITDTAKSLVYLASAISTSGAVIVSRKLVAGDYGP